MITVSGNLCAHCKENKESWLDGLLVASSYNNSLLKNILHSFKYRFISSLSEPLSKIMLSSLVGSDFTIPHFIIPVPLHKKKLRYRGFNQSLLLANAISDNLTPPIKIAVADILERKKHTRAQMEIKNYQQRIQNVKNIFELKPGFDKLLIKNKIVLLVDDIATTGATLQECARILKENEVKKVFAVVVARQAVK
ncbi:MAG: phosphoribosyltransferase family protein [Parcubacteria group bacterium]|jgi:ComF family protein